MTRFAILISVEEYKEFCPTNFTHADCDLLYDALTTKCDYAKQHTIIFKLSPLETKSPLEILSDIKTIISNSTFGDSILFYFAGHGHFYENRPYLILPDTIPGKFETTALPLDDLSNELRVNDRACFRLFDACHSGSDVRDGKAQLNSNDFIRSISHDSSGWVTIAACKEEQYSISDPQIGHGLFTYYLCDEITNYVADQHIYPELLKINIADKVLNHSKRLGFTQTPTLNAAIAGNISIATRRVDVAKTISENSDNKTDTEKINLRIVNLRSVKDVLTSEHLEEYLNIFCSQCLEDFNQLNCWDFNISLGDKISANEIPQNMHSYIVNFARNTGITARHELIREEKYVERSRSYIDVAMGRYPSERKVVSYYVSQPNEMPYSASILNLNGDCRCVPNIKALLYLIPLQITACMLVSVYNYGWNNIDDIDYIKNFYQIIKPNDTEKRIKEIGYFSAKGAYNKISAIISSRVDLLERELKE